MTIPRGALLVVAAAALFGTTGTAQELGPDASGPVSVGAVRLVIAGVALVLLRLAVRRERVRLPVGPSALAIAAMVVYNPLFFSGVDRTGVAIGTVVALGSAPILAGGFGLATGASPDRRWLLATLLALVGLVALVGSEGGDLDAAGLVAAIGAGAAYSTYAFAAHRLSTTSDALTIAAVVFGGAGLVSLPVLLATDTGWIGSPGGWATALWLGLAATALAYVLFTAGVRDTGPAGATTLTLAEPVTASVLAVVVVGERLEPLAWAGLVLVVAALLAMTYTDQNVF